MGVRSKKIIAGTMHRGNRFWYQFLNISFEKRTSDKRMRPSPHSPPHHHLNPPHQPVFLQALYRIRIRRIRIQPKFQDASEFQSNTDPGRLITPAEYSKCVLHLLNQQKVKKNCPYIKSLLLNY